MDHLSDKGLFSAVMRGDRDAFENLFQKYYVALCHYSGTYLDHPGEAEDVVQDVFVNIWKQRGSIRIQTTVQTYLYSSVKHGSLNILKHRAVERSHNRGLIEFLENQCRTDYSEEEEKRLEQIRIAFQQLPEQCRNVFMMNCFEGKKYTEIADALNISVNTVKSHMLKAYRMIREQVTGHDLFILFFIFVRQQYFRNREKSDFQK